MKIADEENGLEFFDLKIKCVNGKQYADVYSKPTNTLYHKRAIQ